MPRAQLFFIPVLVVIDDADSEPHPTGFDFETDGESVTETRAILAGPGIRKATRIINERRSA